LAERATLLQFSRQRVPDPRPCSGKAPVAVRIVCTSNDTRQWIGWPETVRSGVGDRLAIVWQLRWCQLLKAHLFSWA